MSRRYFHYHVSLSQYHFPKKIRTFNPILFKAAEILFSVLFDAKSITGAISNEGREKDREEVFECRCQKGESQGRSLRQMYSSPINLSSS